MTAPTPPNRALQRLDAALAAAAHPLDRAQRLAERAALLARLGRRDEAAVDRAAAQAERATAFDPAVSAALAMAEAMADFFLDFNLSARDRLRRAHALAAAARLRPQQALAAAWLAHLAYLQHDLPALARHLDEALSESGPSDHDTRARACLVVAQALHWAGDEAAAGPWYAQAREQAQAAGDDATRSALMHNQAWLRGVQARQRLLWGDAPAAAPPPARSPSPVALHAEAARNLDRLIGSRSLDASLDLLHALLQVDGGEPDPAGTALQRLRPVLAQQGLGHLMAWLEADLAWCALQSQPPDGQAARHHALAATVALDAQSEAEDRGLTHARLAQVQHRLGADEAAFHHRTCAQADLQAHRERQAALLRALTPVLERHRPQ